MLQRIQTVYMLGSVVAVLMMLLYPLGTFAAPEATFNLSALGVSSVTEGVVLDEMRYAMLFVLALMFALPLACIFLYTHRKLQLRILIYTALLDVLFYPFFFLYEVKASLGLAVSALLDNGIESVPEVSYQFTLYAMPIVSIFCCIMAFRGVTYDIALLASADRLRPSRNR